MLGEVGVRAEADELGLTLLRLVTRIAAPAVVSVWYLLETVKVEVHTNLLAQDTLINEHTSAAEVGLAAGTVVVELMSLKYCLNIFLVAPIAEHGSLSVGVAKHHVVLVAKTAERSPLS